MDLGCDPSMSDPASADFWDLNRVVEPDDEISRAVEEAMNRLNEQERYFIIRYYYMGQSYGEMSRLSGRAIHRLTAIHGRALRKLRARLADFVRGRYRIDTELGRGCVICQSPFRDEINSLIRAHTGTWRAVMANLKSRYSLEIKSPQVLVGHEKYH